MISDFQQLTIFAKLSILELGQGSKYASTKLSSTYVLSMFF